MPPLTDPQAVFATLDEPRKRMVQLAICRRALRIWEAYLRRYGPVEYVDSVVGLYHLFRSAVAGAAIDAWLIVNQALEVQFRTEAIR